MQVPLLLQVIGCDGIWELLSSAEVVEFVRRRIEVRERIFENFLHQLYLLPLLLLPLLLLQLLLLPLLLLQRLLLQLLLLHRARMPFSGGG